MLKRLPAILITLGWLLPVTAYAWDHQRTGFRLGLGVGGGYASMRQSMAYGENIADETQLDNAAFGVRTEVGYAPNRHWTLSLLNSSAIPHNGADPQLLSVLGRNVTFGIACPAVRYYMAERAPSLFVGGGVGMAYYTEVLSLFGSKGSIGLGFVITAGYEFASHFSVMVDWIVGRPRKLWENEERKDNFMTISAMVCWTGY